LIHHNYHDISGWFDFQDLYSAAVECAPQVARFCEVGTWMGKSLTYLATEIVNSGKKIELWSVDSLHIVDIPRFMPRFDDTELEKARKHNGRNLRDVLAENLDLCLAMGLEWRHLCGESALMPNRFADDVFDFVFIDANHTYEAALADILAWKPKVKPGGWFAGHDHTTSFPGVERACKEVFGEGNYKAMRSSWMFEVSR
jgi:predicted O-methyltransferase YrrM